jgi:aminopeptidase N
VGAEVYKSALDLYFERHDGQACTIEDWLKVFEDTSGRDPTQFKLWYSQAGTPRVTATEAWTGGTYRLELAQVTPPTPGQPEKAPVVIPLAYGLIGPDGETVAEGLLELDDPAQIFEWELPDRPVPSLLRGFSAPVILNRKTTPAERAFLLAHDTDPFNRWEAGHGYALALLARMAGDPAAEADGEFLAALAAVAADERPDPAFKALLLGLPSEDEVIAHMAAEGLTPDPLAIWQARRRLEAWVAEALAGMTAEIYAANAVPGPYSPDAAAAGHRALRGRALALLTARDPEAAAARAQFAAADNMTERMAALGLLVAYGGAEAELRSFYDGWQHDRLVVDKWFAVQATRTPPDRAVAAVERLTRHPDFDWKNPNRFRSLVGSFAMGNPAGFHASDGEGYRLLVDWLVRLDPVNPQTTARLTAAFGNWRVFDAGRQGMIRAELERLEALPGLSRDTGEMVGRLLRGGEG